MRGGAIRVPGLRGGKAALGALKSFPLLPVPLNPWRARRWLLVSFLRFLVAELRGGPFLMEPEKASLPRGMAGSALGLGLSLLSQLPGRTSASLLLPLSLLALRGQRRTCCPLQAPLDCGRRTPSHLFFAKKAPGAAHRLRSSARCIGFELYFTPYLFCSFNHRPPPPAFPAASIHFKRLYHVLFPAVRME